MTGTVPCARPRRFPDWPGQVTRSYRFRANTLIEIKPPLPDWPLDQEHWWLYRRRIGQYQARQAPMKEVTRFATPFALQW